MFPGNVLFLPYCVKSLGDNRYVILNRDYKPLGMYRKQWDYDYAKFAVIIPRFTAIRQRNIDCHGHTFEENGPAHQPSLFLLEHTPTLDDPNYVRRLQKLCSMRMEAEKTSLSAAALLETASQ